MATVQTSPPREDLCRSVPFTLARDGESGGDGLTFEGYGAVFNTSTRIDSWEGTFDEQVAPGAFKKSIRENTPRFQFDHGHHDFFGSLPMGVITDIHEDTSGLFVEARISSSWFWEPVREAIAAGAVDGMSFRFSVVREEWRDRAGKVVKPEEVGDILWKDIEGRGPLLRTLKELKVAEVGPVVWPAYEQTSASVRSSQVIDLGRPIDLEQRKLLARAVFMADTADNSADAERSEDEPQNTTPDVAVEHSEQDTATPQPTDPAGEHETDPPEPAPVDDVDAARAAAFEHQFEVALNEVTFARASTPPLRKPQ